MAVTAKMTCPKAETLKYDSNVQVRVFGIGHDTSKFVNELKIVH